VGTRLISVGNASDLKLGPEPPTLEGTSPGSPGESTEPLIFGLAEAGSLIKVYPRAGCFGEPIATGTAEELADPGIRVVVAPNSTSTFFATAEAEGFTSFCSNMVGYTQQAPAGPTPPGSTDEGGGAAPPIGESTGRPKPETHDGIPFVAPLVKITFGPAAKTRVKRPVFRFTDASGQPGTRFRCKLDRAAWRACSSPKRLKPLRGGRHVFKVEAVNAVGVPAERPARRAFKVVAR
jgi:hypothetical protein